MMTGKKVFLLLLILLGLGLAGFFFYRFYTVRQASEPAAVAEMGAVPSAPSASEVPGSGQNSAGLDEAAGNSENPEDIFTLALKEIELAQGGGGVEEWRLKANWAAMRKESEIITLTRPVVTYFMPENRGELQVTSSTGAVDQANRNVTMQGDVVAVNSDMTLNTTEMFYESATRQMKFDKGASFSGEKVSGKADNLVWKMDERVIEATGGVVVDIKGGSPKKLF